MRIISRTFAVPKAGNSAAEYEDAAWPSETLDLSCSLHRTSVADGATETSFSAQWAALLAHAYGEGALFDSDPVQVSLMPLQKSWKERIGTTPLPWYAEQKLEAGAFASFLGLTLSESGDFRSWKSVAVGDSCLFQLRGKELVRSFPLETSDQFGSRPALIASTPMSNADIDQHTASARGEWEYRDRFLLMTDALACWFMKRRETNAWAEDPFGFLDEFDCPGAFEAFVNGERSVPDVGPPALKNDDTTLIDVHVLQG
jgi:hypothetical protein